MLTDKHAMDRWFRLGPRWVPGAASAALLACGQPSATEPSARPASVAAPTLAPPSTRERVLAELAPLPAPAIIVVFDVEGVGGLRGTLELLARPGGYRRENWRLSLPLADDASEQFTIEGSVIQTPDAVVVDAADGHRRSYAVGLGALADAYLRAPEAERSVALREVRRWYTDLAEARATQPGDRETILGVACLRIRVADRSLWVWEETGIPLAFEGGPLRVRARAIDHHATIGPRAFALPPADVAAVPVLDVAPADAVMDALASGDASGLVELTLPRLHIPEQAFAAG